MVTAQQLMHNNPSDLQLATMEREVVEEYHIMHEAYIKFLSDKAKLAWIRDGDENSALLHQSIKARRLHNHIYMMRKVIGIILLRMSLSLFYPTMKSYWGRVIYLERLS